MQAARSRSWTAAADNVIVEDGGQLTILAGDSAFNTSVGSGGLETVSSGGTASGTFVTSGGSEFVSFGGTTLGTTVTSNGSQDGARHRLRHDGERGRLGVRQLGGRDERHGSRSGGREVVSSGGHNAGLASDVRWHSDGRRRHGEQHAGERRPASKSSRRAASRAVR